MHFLCLRRQGLQRDAAILLPVPEHLLRIWLQLLHQLQQHARVLRHQRLMQPA